MREWSLHNAKNRFSKLVNAALAGKPQRVRCRGHLAVVIVAAEEYEQLRRLEESHIPTFGELLLEIPQDDQEFDGLGIAHAPIDL